MDQNANGTNDENPLNTTQYPAGYTGLTPGDVYAAPMGQLTAPVTFTTAQSILSPPFDQNTLPLIVSGPQVLTTQAIGTSGAGSTGSGNLLTNDSTSQLNVTFDRRGVVNTAGSGKTPTAGSFNPGQVVSIIETERFDPGHRRLSALPRSTRRSIPRRPRAPAPSTRR